MRALNITFLLSTKGIFPQFLSSNHFYDFFKHSLKDIECTKKGVFFSVKLYKRNMICISDKKGNIS